MVLVGISGICIHVNLVPELYTARKSPDSIIDYGIDGVGVVLDLAGGICSVNESERVEKLSILDRLRYCAARNVVEFLFAEDFLLQDFFCHFIYLQKFF